MDRKTEPPGRSQRPALIKPGSRVEYFWLCGPCSKRMTMTYDRESGVIVVPKSGKPGMPGAAAS